MTDRPYKSGPSDIHGLGVIATRLIRAGERISFGLGGEFRGYNHSCAPTLSGLVFRGDTASYRVALCDIYEHAELTVDYCEWGRGFEFICRCPKCRHD